MSPHSKHHLDGIAARLRATWRSRAALGARTVRVAHSMSLLATTGLLLAACTGSLLPQPSAPPVRLTLDGGAPLAAPRAAVATATANASAAAGTRAGAGAGAPTLTVDTPRAAPGYDTARMLYLRRAPALEAFARHEWVAPPAQMLAPLLVQALDAGGAFRVVLTSPSAAAGAWRLETELRRLHQDFSQAPSRVRLTLRAVLLHTATRQAVAWREFDVSVTAASDDPVAGAVAAQAAAQQVASAVAVWSAEAMQTAPGHAGADELASKALPPRP